MAFWCQSTVPKCIHTFMFDILNKLNIIFQWKQTGALKKYLSLYKFIVLLFFIGTNINEIVSFVYVCFAYKKACRTRGVTDAFHVIFPSPSPWTVYRASCRAVFISKSMLIIKFYILDHFISKSTKIGHFRCHLVYFTIEKCPSINLVRL